MKRILVVVPAYNAEATIVDFVEKIQQISAIDVLVIDHGSTDTTKKLLRINRIPHINMPLPTSYYTALKLGLEYAKANDYDGVIEFDDKGRFRIEEIPIFLDAYNNNQVDFVLGTRAWVRMPRGSHRMARVLLKKTIAFVTKKTLTDPTMRFRLYGKRVIDMFATHENLQPSADTIAQLIGDHFTFTEINVKLGDGFISQSHKKGVRAFWEVLYLLLSILLVKPFKRKIEV